MQDEPIQLVDRGEETEEDEVSFPEKPSCFGSYEAGHTGCDGPYGGDDPCLLRELCTSLPKLEQRTGVSAERLARDVDTDDLFGIANGEKELKLVHWGRRIRVVERKKVSNWVLFPRASYYTLESWRQYLHLVNQLRRLFGSYRIADNYRVKKGKREGVWVIRQRYWQVIVGEGVLYSAKYQARGRYIIWYCKGIMTGKGKRIFQVAPRNKPVGLDIGLRYRAETLLPVLGQSMFDEMGSVPYRENPRRRHSYDWMHSIIKAASYRQTELAAIALRRLDDLDLLVRSGD